MRAVLALDIGTSSAKGALYSLQGDALATAQSAYPVHHPAPGHAEQDPQDYLRAGREVTAQLAAAHADIRALSISTQTPSLVFCDESGAALLPAIIWQDARASEEAAEVLALDPALRRTWFGLDLPIGAAATPPKLLWVRRHLPHLWRRTRWIAQPKDFVAFHLTGRMATDHWCAKGLASLLTGAVHPDYLAWLDSPSNPLPDVAQPAHIAGHVTREAAAAWYLPAGIPVTVGWSDALAGIFATGALHRPGTGFVLTGTSEIIGLSRTPGGAHSPGLFSVPGSVLPTACVELEYGPVSGGGSTLAWLTRLTGRTHADLLSQFNPAQLSPILFRPYLDGERAPYWDHTLSAGFDGLRSHHTLADLVHAVLEGVALQERLVLERAEQRTPSREVVLAGGAARDPHWNRLRANILQRPVRVLADPEASLRGVALLAWSATGDMDPAAPPAAWFEGERIAPDPALAAEAESLFARFAL
jgi:xylulokinase